MGQGETEEWAEKLGAFTQELPRGQLSPSHRTLAQNSREHRSPKIKPDLPGCYKGLFVR